MKMENEIRSPADGEIVDLRVQTGDKVPAARCWRSSASRTLPGRSS